MAAAAAAVTPFKFLDSLLLLFVQTKTVLPVRPAAPSLIFLCLTFLAVSSGDSSSWRIIRVDQYGKGDHTKIQDAVDSVPSNNAQRVLILVKPGTYREKIDVPKNKPFITLSGTEASKTIITLAHGGGILNSATMSVSAPDFVARHLTIQNTLGTSGVGIALSVSGDRAAFYGCRIISYQDTLLDDAGRHYYKDCYIEGGTDFICGNAASLFENCHIHSVSQKDGSVTAHHRNSESEDTGFIFYKCRLTGDGKMFLGRPWGPAARVLFAQTYMSSAVLAEGWNDWGDPRRQRTAFYGEYNCKGPGANITKRVRWSHNLSSKEAAPFLSKCMNGGEGWLRPAPVNTHKSCNCTEVKHPLTPIVKDDKKKHSTSTPVRGKTEKKHPPVTSSKGDHRKKNYRRLFRVVEA